MCIRDRYQRASDSPVLRILKNLKPSYYNEKFLIKDKNGKILKKAEILDELIDITCSNNLKMVKYVRDKKITKPVLNGLSFQVLKENL